MIAIKVDRRGLANPLLYSVEVLARITDLRHVRDIRVSSEGKVGMIAWERSSCAGVLLPPFGSAAKHRN